MRKRRSALVLLSGGIDSAVVSLIAASRHRRLLFLSFNYGQRNIRELVAARQIASLFRTKGPHDEVAIDLTGVTRSGCSELLADAGSPPTGQDSSRNYYVPGRNLIFLAHAAAIAEAAHLDTIYIGSNLQDAQDPAGRGYPDSGEAFIRLAEKTLNCGLKFSPGVTVEAPLLCMNKFEVIRHGHRRRFDFRLTWSCYKNETKACAVCPACRGRLINFHWAGLVDPIPYSIPFDKALALALVPTARA